MSSSTKVRPAINRKAAEKFLRQVVKGREDYVDTNALNDRSCRYLSRSGDPSCIVGNLLDAAGVKIPFTPRSRTNTDGIKTLAAKHPELFTPGAVKLLSAAQDLQDSGHAWGKVAQIVLSHKKDAP